MLNDVASELENKQDCIALFIDWFAFNITEYQFVLKGVESIGFDEN